MTTVDKLSAMRHKRYLACGFLGEKCCRAQRVRYCLVVWCLPLHSAQGQVTMATSLHQEWNNCSSEIPKWMVRLVKGDSLVQSVCLRIIVTYQPFLLLCVSRIIHCMHLCIYYSKCKSAIKAVLLMSQEY